MSNQQKLGERVNVYPGSPSLAARLPDLIEIQKQSFRWFLAEGLKEELVSFSPIVDYSNRLELHFLTGYTLGEAKYTVEDCRSRDATYSRPLRIPVRLITKETGEIKEQEIFIGELPVMTPQGTFIINGAERVIVSQIVRSPGVYFKRETDPSGKKIYSATIIPNRGAWLKFETDVNDQIFVRIDKTRKLHATVLLRAIGYQDTDMLDLFRHREYLQKTLAADKTEHTIDASFIEVYKKLRPGDMPSVEGGRSVLSSRFFDAKRYDVGKVGRYKLNKKLGINIPIAERVLCKEDIVGVIDYLINLNYDLGSVDDIDHLGNRRIRSVGELLQNQFRVGLTRLERIIKERMTIQEADTLTPQNLVNAKPLVAAIKEFFGSSQLSQFMDQTNPLAELTHKRRLSALGPGGLSRERAGFAVRDIHPSHYGRICPIETPEGPNAGLIGSLSTYARVNEFGFIETPYRKVVRGRVTDDVVYLTADEEDEFKVAPGDVQIDQNGCFVSSRVPVRFKSEFIHADPEDVNLVGVSPIQIISVATAMIPFLEHDDANRALMGSNMQRQAVPLLRAERPRVGTGIEKRTALDSGMIVTAKDTGVVQRVTASDIVVVEDSGRTRSYHLLKFLRSNQDTCINQRPIVRKGQRVEKGQVLADGAATEQGELALGRNILVAFVPWEGYNYEDAILLSQRLVWDDVFTSIHIEKYEIEARATKLGNEEITREVPNVGDEALKDLDERGVIRIGAEVEPDDILVGKVTPKGESEHPPEEKLLRAIFGEKARDVRDTSLRVPHGEKGWVVDVKVFSRDKNDELPPGVNQVVRVYVAQKRKISVGDKIAGRHGNKGIVAKILPEEDMPFLPDGTPVDVVLNPLGVPSRMNVGQTYETILGRAAELLNEYYSVPPFDEMFGEEASDRLISGKMREAEEKNSTGWLREDGKCTIYDGRTGEPFDRPVTVGSIYVMKLVHLVDDKIHARSTGPYSLVTQQPLGGKAQFGGQRFGEMEVWALEAYGTAYTLQEMLTIKSDDVPGRAKAYEAIVKGKNLSKPGIPESFKVLIRELQSLCLDMHVARGDGQEIELFEAEEEPRQRFRTQLLKPPGIAEYESLK
ncbi:MAG: DNA-directed RNA polymerase subunit beta [Cyanobacteria bacterium NC_groundwater_1444_Ag_S-0.65um_54_12]|nr:DNA-directed RNA polymerase subunit beta [Cyanobacteria bacterium NC_groundwater_1444_Ag_S-0.65um_54_12]